jgi:hypothetical protein
MNLLNQLTPPSKIGFEEVSDDEEIMDIQSEPSNEELISM